MEELTKGRMQYGWMWVWLSLVTLLTYIAYRELVGLAGAFAADFPTLAKALSARDGNWTAFVLQVLGGFLIWWRVVKVVVLHGSPFSWGMIGGFGDPSKSAGERPGTFHCIGNFDVNRKPYTGGFWLGTVFRPHPKSDKLARTRLVLLICVLPFGYTFFVVGSRFHITKQTHHERAT